MKSNPQRIIRELSTFTGHHLTDFKILLLDDFLNIDNYRKAMMKAARSDEERLQSSKFFRKGKVGDWKTHLSDEMMDKIDDWIKSNKKSVKDLQFDFE